MPQCNMESLENSKAQKCMKVFNSTFVDFCIKRTLQFVKLYHQYNSAHGTSSSAFGIWHLALNKPFT